MRHSDLPTSRICDRAGDPAKRTPKQLRSSRLPAGCLRASESRRDFRVFGPDETVSNRFEGIRGDEPRLGRRDGSLRRAPRAKTGVSWRFLSEHTCQGWLEGYLLTGRHGLFNCYEPSSTSLTRMFNQHAKWLKSCNEISWRRPIASLNYLLTSHVWRQDHNGFSHQDPGFIDYVCNKKSDIVRVYLPPDANSLLFVTDHCLGSWNRINVIVAGKQLARNGSAWTRRSTLTRLE